ncbi:MAG: TrmJ/YjtD family RNA methyltransferase [Candidatus Heimdallarchaeota archaeon]|nr:TrmJ/YjtD family RNA methyltransferase [Candidatus Heimdallarchaeota archaeon]
MSIKIVLVEPETPGNIGATARVMKNFDFSDLILINPQTSLTSETYQFAKNAQDVLERMTIYNSLEEFTRKVSYVVGTTAKTCSDGGPTNVRVAVSSHHQSLTNLLHFRDDLAILFGRESYGLTNEEINLCDMTIHIPTSENYRALNLAQAVAIILYSLHIRRGNLEKEKYRGAKREEKEFLIKWFAKAASVLGFSERKEEILVRRFRNIVGRAFVSGREAHSLLAIFSRTYNRIKRCNELLKQEDQEK